MILLILPGYCLICEGFCKPCPTHAHEGPILHCDAPDRLQGLSGPPQEAGGVAQWATPLASWALCHTHTAVPSPMQQDTGLFRTCRLSNGCCTVIPGSDSGITLLGMLRDTEGFPVILSDTAGILLGRISVLWGCCDPGVSQSILEYPQPRIIRILV